jgi:ferredoxin
VSDLITRAGLLALVDQLLTCGVRVVGPVSPAGPGPAGRTRFAVLTEAQQLLLDGFIHPANTAKDLVLPKTEKLYGYRREGRAVRLLEPETEPRPTVLIGCRPCDAAAFPIVDQVMNWDYADSQYNRRRSALTVITLACDSWDEQCFCTSVGLGPAAERGSDALLLSRPDGSFTVRQLTDRGREFFADQVEPAAQPDVEVGVGPAVIVDLDRAAQRIREGFDDPIWAELGLRCLGCGSCTYTCPTCHCFDIVDETQGTGGCRIRNWDSCQFAGFTAHASGHNPRADQGARQRQRSTHKFVIYPDKFGEVLCTGCGNCYRNCPVGLGVLQVLRAMDPSSTAVGSQNG